MVTIYPFVGLHPSDEAFAFVPSVPYDVISAEEAAAEIAKNDKTLLQMQNCRILIRMTIVSMNAPVRCLQR